MIPILEPELYNKTASIEHVKALAFNRSASSVGSTEAVNYIEGELEKSNLNSKIHYFSWSGPTRILMRVAYLVLISFLLLVRAILIIIAYFLIKNMFKKTREMTLITKEVSKNIYVKIPSEQNITKPPLVIFSAHYDSISGNIPYRIQVILFFFYKVIVVFYVLLIIILSPWLILYFVGIFTLPNYIIIMIISLSLIGIILCIPILYLIFNECSSSGSIDNASGVAILIELAKYFTEYPLKNIGLLFIWPGAEEWGLKGSKSFCKQYFKALSTQYDFNKSININIDMVGTYIGLLNKVGLIRRRRLAKTANLIIEETAMELNIPIKKYNKIFEPKSDHKSFKKYARKLGKRLQIVYFHSDKDSKYIHSLKDTPDKCSIENLNGCVNICAQALKNWDSRIQ